MSATRHRIPPVVWFLAAVAVVSLGYTRLAFGMEWRTPAGRIGAGFFPRVIGIAMFGACVLAIARQMREAWRTEDAEGGETGPQHTLVLLFTVAVMGGFVTVLIPVGAILTSAGFLAILLAVLNRGHHVTNVALSVLLPVGLYALLQSWLNAGLPSGVLPPF